MTKIEISWLKAIEEVLKDVKRPLHYSEIAKQIAERGIRSTLGVNPAKTVNGTISTNMKDKKNTLFAKTDMGCYILKKFAKDWESVGEIITENDSLIENFGIRWDRNKIEWRSNPDLFGITQKGANPINFKDQIGIYVLYDYGKISYVGKATKQSIGTRLFQHIDKNDKRWNEFSWFGFYGINEEKGILLKSKETVSINFEKLANSIETVLIDLIEPYRNRKRGDENSILEFFHFI